jgi:hypothetical protein
MHWILDFIHAHQRPIASIGVICGMAPWMLRLIDKVVPARHKENFGRWVNALVPPMEAWRPDDLYLWASANLRKTQLLGLTAVAAGEAIIVRRLLLLIPNNERRLAAAVCAFGGALIMKLAWDLIGAILGYASILEALRQFPRRLRHSEPPIFTAGMLLVASIALIYLIRGKTEEYLHGTTPLLFWPIIATTVPLCLGVAELYVLTFLRFPFGLLTRCVRWLAYHPKGAWGALILAIGSAFDLFRLIFQ